MHLPPRALLWFTGKQNPQLAQQQYGRSGGTEGRLGEQVILVVGYIQQFKELLLTSSVIGSSKFEQFRLLK